MKKLLIIITLFVLFPNGLLFGQGVPRDSLILQRIIDVPNISADSLRTIVRKWFESTSFIAYPHRIIFISISSNHVAGDYSIDYRDGGTWYRSWQTLTIEMKDEMIRVTFENPYMELVVGKGTNRERVWPDNLIEYRRYGNGLKFVRNNWRANIKSLQNWIMTGYKESEKNANW
jgi:hypothetical protein